jgi:hypothetical protein
VKQIRLVFGLEPEADPPIAFEPEVLERLVALMAEALVEVHKAAGGRSND